MDLLNLTLLYVEDEKDVRDSLSEVFRHRVKKLFIAKDGQEALEIFKNEKIHFVISDYKMPFMNGGELCKNIKQIDPLTQFILLTAYNDTEILLNSIDAGVDKYLQKPINQKQLFNAISDVYNNLVTKFNLEKTNRYLKEVEKIAQIAYWEYDHFKNKTIFSKDAIELFGIEYSENITYKELLKNIQDEYKKSFLDIFENRIFSEKELNEVIVLNKDGKDIYINIVTKEWESLTYGSKNIIGIFQDVTTYELEKLKLLENSLTDYMLKIANKQMINLELNNLIKSAKRYNHDLGVLFFDIDNFKAINEKYGHLLADKILVELVELIKNDIRSSDLFGRWGGDEFVIITGYSSQEETKLLAKKVLDKVANHKWPENINLGVSIGIAFYKDGDDANLILNRADEKMLEAKHNGKHRCRC